MTVRLRCGGWKGQTETHITDHSVSQCDQANKVQLIKGIGMQIKDAVIRIIIYNRVS